MLVDVDDVFCRYALEHGFVTKSELEACRSMQKQEARDGRHYYVGQVLIRQRVISCEDFLEIENAIDQKIYECATCKTRYARKDLAPGALTCKGCGQKVGVDGRGRLSMAEILASRDPRDLTISLVSGAAAAPAGPDPLATRTSERRRSAPRTSERRVGADERPPAQTQRRQRLNRKALEVDQKDLEGLERYEILEELGRGGMGVVFKARQVDIDRLCALKVIKAGPNVPEVQINRFVQEGKSAARLGHPNIVTIYDCGRFRDTFYVAMELIPGRALSAVIQELGRVPIDQALGVLLDILAAVHYAHEHGVIHRDLKPGNILVEDDRGRARLIDFGLAKDHEQSLGLTQEGQILGSPFYLSPEQTRGKSKDVDARSDIFALGVILYEMLTGQRPFTGRSAAEVYSKILHSRPAPPAALEPEIDQELQAIVLKALEKDPAARYADADAFAQAIEAYRRERATRGSRRGRNTPRSMKLPRTSTRVRSAGMPERAPEPRGGGGGRHLALVLLGAGVIGVGALAVLGRGAAGGPVEPPPVVTTERPARPGSEAPGDLVDDDDAQVTPPPTDMRGPAERAFVAAQDYRRTNPDDLSGAIERLRDVAARGGSWGARAADAVRELEELAVSQVAAVTSDARARAATGELAAALGALEEARARFEGAGRAAAALREEHATLVGAARARAQAVARQVDDALLAGDLDAAVVAAQGYAPVGVDEVDSLVRQANQRLGEAQRERAKAEADRARQARDELEGALAALDELVKARRYAEARARVEELAKHPALALVRGAEAGLRRRGEEARLALSVLEATSALGERARGAALELDGLKGRVERVEGGVLALKLASGGIVERRVAELDAEVVTRLHALGHGEPADHLARGVYLLLEGRDAAALAAFEEARKGGAPLGAFEDDLRRLERARDGATSTATTTDRPGSSSTAAVKDDAAMVLIPAGTFFMGVDTNRIEADRADEAPGRRITLAAFRIDRYEVTNRQYAEFLEWLKKNERNRHRHCSPLEPPNKDHTPQLWGDPRVSGEGQPVVGVDWFDAFAFAAWSGKRLPTEAEWERAARSADGRAWPWGSTWDPFKAVFAESLWGRPITTRADLERFAEWTRTAPRLTLPVNLLPAGKSQDELFHTAGNVSEWVADWYDIDYYLRPRSAAEDTDPKGPRSGSQRVARGGSWADVRPVDLACTAREPLEPTQRAAWLGFRCAADADAGGRPGRR